MQRNSRGVQQVPRWQVVSRWGAGLGVLLAMSGCGTADRSGSHPTFASPSAAVPAVVKPAISTPAPATPASAPLPDASTCTVAQVVAIAREHTPTRAVLDANRAAAKAAVLQAQAIANPEVELEGGQGRPRNGDSTESIGRITLRQRLELPGKRSSRVSAAEAGMTVAEQDALALSIDLEAMVREAIANDASATMASTQALKAVELATQIAETVQHRVAAGEGDRGDALRAELDRRQASISADQRQQAAVAARRALQAVCGGGLPDTFTITDAWEGSWNPTRDEVLVAMEHHPRLERQRALRALRFAEVRREEASGRPDVTVGAFAGRATDATEVGLTVAVDLPVWSRNQGGIAAAQADLQRSDAEAEADRRALRQSIDSAWATFQAAMSRRDRLIAEVEPMTAELLKLRLNAYATGDIGLLDVLDARRTSQTIADDLLASRAEVARARIQLLVALGRFAPFVPAHLPEATP